MTGVIFPLWTDTNLLEICEKFNKTKLLYLDVEKKVGKREMKNIPYGAIAFWTMADKLACGLQQLMAGARKFSTDQITREDIFSGNRETARETGIKHISDVNDETAKKILNS